MLCAEIKSREQQQQPQQHDKFAYKQSAKEEFRWRSQQKVNDNESPPSPSPSPHSLKRKQSETEPDLNLVIEFKPLAYAIYTTHRGHTKALTFKCSAVGNTHEKTHNHTHTHIELYSYLSFLYAPRKASAKWNLCVGWQSFSSFTGSEPNAKIPQDLGRLREAIQPTSRVSL